MVTKLGPPCEVKLLKNGRDKLVVRSPEKAGVGGSTPSLATIILKNLAESRLTLPVRSQSAIFRRDPVRFPAAMMVKDLTSSGLSLSPLSVRITSADNLPELRTTMGSLQKEAHRTGSNTKIAAS